MPTPNSIAMVFELPTYNVLGRELFVRVEVPSPRISTRDTDTAIRVHSGQIKIRVQVQED